MRLGTGSDWFARVDSSPDEVIAVHFAGEVTGLQRSRRHSHRKAQLLFTIRGLINCQVDDGIWVVPPQSAVWIPTGLLHTTFGSGHIECICLFVEPRDGQKLPATCCTMTVSVLLRELLMRAAEFPEKYVGSGRDDRLFAVLLDELADAPIENLRLPLPQDSRLKKLADRLLTNPTDRASLGEWASRVALSERSLSRILKDEVGMSFGRWRRQLHVVLAIRRLAAGDSVESVAFGLGYESSSSFITMFRKALGKSPARYINGLSTSGRDDDR